MLMRFVCAATHSLGNRTADRTLQDSIGQFPLLFQANTLVVIVPDASNKGPKASQQALREALLPRYAILRRLNSLL